MANENRDLMVARRNELKAAATQEGRQLAKGALEVSRKPLHDLGSNLLDYLLDWVIGKVCGSTN